VGRCSVMFHPSQYEGLPFVGRRRLRSFLARWYDDEGEPLSLLRTPAPSPEASKSRDSLESSDGLEEAAFLQDYFQSQEQAYHAMLRFISQVSVHLNYWLDWATPVRRRPRWAHRLGRKLWSSWLVLLGQPQVTLPERCASQFARLNEELCRLLAFIQVSSFELLSSCLDTEAERCQALTKALHSLAWQTRVAAATAAELSSASTRRWLGNARLWDQVRDLEAVSMPDSSNGSSKHSAYSQESLVKKGRLQLQQNNLAFEVMADSMINFMEGNGQMSHIHKWWPLYSGATLGALLLSWRLRLSDRSVRETLAKQAKEVVIQFLREWIVSPIEQVVEALFLRSPKDDLRVQLRDLRAEEETLDRMVSGFAKFARAESHFKSEAGGAGDEELPERYFEWSMTKPISNVITGHLMESCMVQSQKLKVLLYASLYSIDAVMTQLKWDFVMAGVMPMTLLCFSVYWIISGSRRRRQLDFRKKMVRALAEMDRYLNRNIQSLAPRHVSFGIAQQLQRPKRAGQDIAAAGFPSEGGVDLDKAAGGVPSPPQQVCDASMRFVSTFAGLLIYFRTFGRCTMSLLAVLLSAAVAHKIQSPVAVLDDNASDCAAALLQRQADKVEQKAANSPKLKEDVEWRARQMVLLKAQEEAVAQSWSRLLGWFSNEKIQTAMEVPLIRQWHVVSEQLLDRGLTTKDCKDTVRPEAGIMAPYADPGAASSGYGHAHARCLAGTAASLPTTPLILREAGRPAPLESVDSTLASVTPVRYSPSRIEDSYAGLDFAGKVEAAQPAGRELMLEGVWASKLRAAEEEKLELLRKLEAENRRNVELEGERKGLKTSLDRMEKLLSDMAVASLPPQDVRALSPPSLRASFTEASEAIRSRGGREALSPQSAQPHVLSPSRFGWSRVGQRVGSEPSAPRVGPSIGADSQNLGLFVASLWFQWSSQVFRGVQRTACAYLCQLSVNFLHSPDLQVTRDNDRYSFAMLKTTLQLLWSDVMSSAGSGNEAAMSVQRERKKPRYLLAGASACISLDDLYSASLHFVHLQRHLGVFVGEPSAEEARRALARRAALAAAELLRLGSRVGLPADVWRRVIRTALPLQSFGFEEGFPKLSELAATTGLKHNMGASADISCRRECAALNWALVSCVNEGPLAYTYGRWLRRQDAELAAAVRAAELAALQVERRKAEQERTKQEEKRKKAQKLLSDTKMALEAAFDGDVDALLKLLDSGMPADAANPAGITPLSEAAAAGKEETAQVLLERKANPNSRGEFNRTPLWRAAYSRHSNLVPLLLEAGADPRLRDDEGQTPADVCAQDELCELFAAWDVSRTDELVEDFQDWVAEIQRQEQHRQREAMRYVEEAFEAAVKAYEATQMMLAKAKAQMRNREKEYGMKLAAGHKDAVDACASADAALQRAEAEAASAQRDFDEAQRRRLAAAEAVGAEAQVGPGRLVPVAQLNNVLLRDLGERIAQGGPWPLVLDPGDVAQKLIQYSGSSLLNFFRSGDMEPERIRIALLNMIRGGGVLAVDLHGFGAGVGLELLSQPFENVRENLFQDLCSRTLLQAAKGKRMPEFYDLVRKEERQERFKAQMFDDKMIARFKFMVLTSTELPHKELLEHFDVIRVVHASA
ncbi:IQANK1, partial [Symbiodinium pilosum]